MSKRGKDLKKSQPYNPHKMTARDLAVFRARNVDGMTVMETAEKLDMSRSMVKRCQKKPAYNQLAIDSLELNDMSINAATQLLIDQTKAEKAIINADGCRIDVPDNVTRLNSVKELLSIYGAYAPKDINVNHQFTDASEEELISELDIACNRIGVVTVEAEPSKELQRDDIQESSGDYVVAGQGNEGHSHETPASCDFTELDK